MESQELPGILCFPAPLPECSAFVAAEKRWAWSAQALWRDVWGERSDMHQSVRLRWSYSVRQAVHHTLQTGNPHQWVKLKSRAYWKEEEDPTNQTQMPLLPKLASQLQGTYRVPHVIRSCLLYSDPCHGHYKTDSSEDSESPHKRIIAGQKAHRVKFLHQTACADTHSQSN